MEHSVSLGALGFTTFTQCSAAHLGRSRLVVVCDNEVPSLENSRKEGGKGTSGASAPSKFPYSEGFLKRKEPPLEKTCLYGPVL